MITALGGIVFAVLHIREWLGLIGEGMTLFKNPWGTGLFGAAFFSVTGLHITHVIVRRDRADGRGLALQGRPLQCG